MGLHIIVCIKAVVTEITGIELDRSGDQCELNPFDRPVLDVALAIKEKTGGTVTALSMGPATVEFALFEAMALGADQGVLISDPALRGSDTIATSTALAAAIETLRPFDLLLFGTQTSDSDAGQVGPQTAAILNLPVLTWAHSIEPEGEALRVERWSDGFREQYRMALPAALTIHPRATDPRMPQLAALERAFGSGQIKTMSLADIGLSANQVGEESSPTRVLSMKAVKKDRSCELIQGPVEEQVAALVAQLTHKAVLR